MLIIIEIVNLDSFNFLKVLGKGAFGVVSLVEKKDSKILYAAKAIDKDLLIEKNQLHNLRTERFVLENVIVMGETY